LKKNFHGENVATVGDFDKPVVLFHGSPNIPQPVPAAAGLARRGQAVFSRAFDRDVEGVFRFYEKGLVIRRSLYGLIPRSLPRL